MVTEQFQSIPKSQRMGNSHKYLIWWEFFNTIIIVLKSFTIRSIGKWMQILVGMIIKRYTSSAILKQHSIYGLYYWYTYGVRRSRGRTGGRICGGFVYSNWIIFRFTLIQLYYFRHGCPSFNEKETAAHIAIIPPWPPRSAMTDRIHRAKNSLLFFSLGSTWHISGSQHSSALRISIARPEVR